MKHTLQNLFDNNRRWVEGVNASNPAFFEELSHQQAPEYLWIGCSDSRVPANQIVGLLPGEVFVHRNVANVVVHTDLNCLSVLQYGIDVLKVKTIIVCGHYGCGGVRAALTDMKLGLIDNWLRHVQDVRHKHAGQIPELITERDTQDAWDRLCELNVLEQVRNIARTTIVQHAWQRGQPLAIHGVIYGVNDGVLRDLNYCVTSAEEADSSYDEAVRHLAGAAKTQAR
jgi:carbonic anhydrase